ncbi:FAD-dependent oxidoreductase [Sinomicrobium pectinilyticum]|uniref:FAD-dependent oxidoreductase n=1 Tax=Sinomicrobium pectinilyticum TaxID=1084421 RepID=A0A3N0DQD8_SINP1|nr:FAD-dependent oxidoreductase [Sinomicrobium pectinilyticum]RNL77849.1 FAD-dependent oxidoreductase [Sinomicrobium pectinilyticum]
MRKTIIIGGGIAGLCSAYYLVKEGHQVTVIDRGDISAGASFINAGYLTPSHIISLAAPGMVSKGLRWMFNSRSPLYIKPRLDPDFIKWGLLFKRSATAQRVEDAIPVIKELNLKSRDLYEAMLDSLDFEFHYGREGVLMVYSDAKAEEEELHLAERALKEGLEAKCLNKEELRALQPVFSDRVRGAVLYECDRHITPNEFMENLKQWLVKKGVEFRLHQEVTDIRTSGNKIVAVQTGRETYEGNEFVLAAGSWTFPLAKKLGLYIPVQGGKGYSMNVKRETGITMPAILTEAKVAVTPMQGFTRFAGSMEFSGNNDYVRKERVEAIADAVTKYYSGIEINAGERAAAVSGLRPVSPDGLPFIGKTAKYNNLTVASGHAMMGFSLGPVTGKLVKQLVTDEKPLMDLSPLRPERFK